MLGRKVTMVPTPAMMPSTIRLVRTSPAWMAVRPEAAASDSQPMATSR